jgi:hypothetical protein
VKKTILFLSLLIGISCSKKPVKKFTKLDRSSTHIDFANLLDETHTFNYFTYPYMYLGAGVGVGDINNDGREDLYFTGNQVPNKLYLNKGDFEFEDITITAGVEGDGRWYSGIAMADVNEDGFVDIYCSVSGKDGVKKNVLYINNQDNTFTEKASEYGIDDPGHSIQSVFFDFDKDGDLDLYVANYPPTSFVAPVDYYAYMLKNTLPEDSDKLYRNDGGYFTDITKESGIENFGLSLGVVVSDFNNDLYPDLYVSNDFNAPDFMYINNQDGTFTNQIKSTLQQTSFFGMGADVADFNNDGWMDLFQLDMSSENNFRSKANMSSMDPDAFYQSVDLGLHHQYMQNSLQFNQGNLKDSLPLFSNISRLAGVSSTDWSWGGLLADFDNDGWKDLIVTNGIRRDVNNKDFYKKYRSFFKKMETDPNYKNKEEEVELLNYLKEMPSEKLSNYIYQNNKNLSFINKIEAWGLEEKTFSNGLAFSDLDNDGDLDFIINNLDDPASIYKNNTTDQNYIHLQLAGKGYQTPLGARVHIQIGKEKQTHEYNVVRGYMSSVSPKIHFGLGKNERIDTLTVQWPNGKLTQLHQVQANQTLNIDYDSVALLESIPEETSSEKLFSTKTDPTPYKHEENPFDDFQKEVLLPHKNSTLGPTLAVGDLNGDDKQDYIIGGAIGQAAKIFIQEQEGHFKEIELDVFEKDKFYEDLGILLIDADQDGDKDLYFASGGNEYAFNSEGYEDRFYENLGDLNFKRNKEAIPSTRISGMDVSSNDFDNDGDLDLFVGGRLYPKKYPYPVSSRILENQSTTGSIRFVDVTEKVAPPLEDIGLVTDSQWLDFDNDQWNDLIIIGEWMDIRFFNNSKGKFEEVTQSLFNSKSKGWWNTIEKGDFDQDGDLDLVVGNLGLNYKYKASEENPFKIYLHDFDENKTSDIVLSYSKGEEEYPVRGRQCSSEQMPAIQHKFKDYNSFASASLQEIYTDKMLGEALSHEIISFQSLYLENTGSGFKAKPLPPLAQLSSINKFIVKDFDKDNKLDIVLAGNLYNSEVETPRNDSSFGLWLKGDGNGNFVPKNGLDSGLRIVGDVRDMELIESDGTTYLLVAKNNDFLQKIEVR